MKNFLRGQYSNRVAYSRYVQVVGRKIIFIPLSLGTKKNMKGGGIPA